MRANTIYPETSAVNWPELTSSELKFNRLRQILLMFHLILFTRVARRTAVEIEANRYSDTCICHQELLRKHEHCAFPVVTPAVWNNFPPSLWLIGMHTQFCTHLEKYLFKLSFEC